MTTGTVSAKGTVAFKSLGCKLNQYEIQALREGFLKHGFAEVTFSEAADYYILNTCTVTQGTDQDARGLIKSFNRLNPDARIIVTGCTVTAHPDDISKLPGVTMVVDNTSKNQILFNVTGIAETSEEESPFFRDGISYFEEHSRAFVKVQDGCNYFCAFCKIPFVRGRLVSRDVAQVEAETRRLVDAGYQEIVLSGVCLGSYGKDRPESGSLAALIERLLAISGNFRLRLSSIDPRDTPLELAELMRASPRLCRHLHLSLQSGDDGILRRMRRSYTTQEFEKLVSDIRRIVPDIGLSTDVIVGFPGEDEVAFENTRIFLERIGFHKVHVFPYSERPNTKAVGMDRKVSVKDIRTRAKRLAESMRPVTNARLAGYLGHEFDILVERSRASGGLWQGFSDHYLHCVSADAAGFEGKLLRVKAVSSSEGRLLTAPVRQTV